MPKETTELIEIITNRLNPRYRKTIQQIPDTIIPPEVLAKEDTSQSLNLRGLEVAREKFPNADTGSSIVNKEETLKALPQVAFSFLNSIVAIDATDLACGGSDNMLSLI